MKRWLFIWKGDVPQNTCLSTLSHSCWSELAHGWTSGRTLAEGRPRLLTPAVVYLLHLSESVPPSRARGFADSEKNQGCDSRRQEGWLLGSEAPGGLQQGSELLLLTVGSHLTLWVHASGCGFMPQFMGSRLTLWFHASVCGLTPHLVGSHFTWWVHASLHGFTPHFWCFHTSLPGFTEQV